MKIFKYTFFGNVLRLLAGTISIYILPKALGLGLYGDFQFLNSLIIKFRDAFVSGSDKAIFSRIVRGVEKSGTLAYPMLLAIIGYLFLYIYSTYTEFSTNYFALLVVFDFVIFSFTIFRYIADLENYTKELQIAWTITTFSKAFLLLIFYVFTEDIWWVNAWLIGSSLIGLIFLIKTYESNKFKFKLPNLETLKVCFVDFQAPIYLANLAGVYLYSKIGSDLSSFDDKLLGVFMLSLQLNGLITLVTNSLQNELWLDSIKFEFSRKRLIFILGVIPFYVFLVWISPYVLLSLGVLTSDSVHWFIMRLTLISVIPISLNQVLSIHFYKIDMSRTYNFLTTLFIFINIAIYTCMNVNVYNVIWFFFLTNCCTALIFSILYVLGKKKVRYT